MNISALDATELRARLERGALTFRIGGFLICLQTSLPSVVQGVRQLYADYPLCADSELADFYVELKTPRLLRQLVRPQVCFSHDGFIPFKPLPLAQAFAMFEWGLNWCVAGSAHQFLVIHAAVVERNGKALIMPGAPGSGKSTLCAALVNRGWRLLSDEMTLLGLDNGLVTPFPRPVSLKNESIDIIRSFSSAVRMGEVVADTSKGTVAHMRPPVDSVARSLELAAPACFVFPKYEAGSSTDLQPLSRGYAYMQVAENSFNYHVLGEEGFAALVDVIGRCDCYSFRYQHLDQAIAVMDRLVGVVDEH